MNRRGVGLVELVIALTLSVMIALLAWSILAVSATRLREGSERIGLTHALRVSAAALRAVVEPLGSDSNGSLDLASFRPDGLTARVIRASGAVCDVGVDRVVVRAGEPWWIGLRVPVAGRDSLLLGTQEAGPRWVAIPLQASPSNTPCPDGSAGLNLPVPAGVLLGVPVAPGSPLRVVEQVELRRYSSAGTGWFGSRLVATGEAIQPLAGPLIGSGLVLTFLRRDGTVASTGMETVLVAVALTGLTERAHGVGVAGGNSARADSAEFSILLRNVP